MRVRPIGCTCPDVRAALSLVLEQRQADRCPVHDAGGHYFPTPSLLSLVDGSSDRSDGPADMEAR